MTLKQWVRLSWLVTSVSFLAACASIPPSPQIPKANGKISINVVYDEPGMNDYPIGTYSIPGSLVLVNKSKEISTVEAGFGLLGALSAHGSGKGASKKAIEGIEDILKVDVVALTNKGFKKTGHKTNSNWVIGGQSELVMEVKPYLFFTRQGDTAKLYLFLKASLKDKGGSTLWDSRYVYYVPKARQIKGAGSWSEKNGVAYKSAIIDGYGEISKVMQADANRGQAGWTQRQAKVKTEFAGMGQEIEMPGVILKETDHTVIFTPKLRSLMSGINIMPRNIVTISN